MAQTIDTARLATAIEKIATSPQTLAFIERATAGAAKAPVSAKLAGVKTYIVAGLGFLSTILVVADAFALHGGLTLTGWLAAIVALVTSTGFATMRAAISGHYGELGGLLLDMGQSIALEVASTQAPAVTAEVAIAAAPAALASTAAAAVAGSTGAIIAAPAVVMSAASQVAGDVVGGMTGGLADIFGAIGVAAPVDLHPKV